jgi:hypothetical protein
MTGRRAIRWLHLSDLHLGCQREDLWWQMQEDLAASVRAFVERLGPPDLLLLSGDLTNTGAAKQFDRVDRLLDTLLGWLAESGGAEPLIVAVPGNHDVQRPPEAKGFQYLILDRYVEAGLEDKYVQSMEDALWTRRDVSVVKPLFANYQKWFRKRLLPELERRAKIHASHFPGDFCLEVEIAGAFPLCLVGLNSTWQQYKGGDFERKLTLPGRQLQATLPPGENGSPLAVFNHHPRALLMQHHPPGWLSPAGGRIFDEQIYPPNRFDLCLFGHMHDGRSMTTSVSGGATRTYFQAPSLFGLEHYGNHNEDRLMGYAWGSLSADGEVRIWPLERVNRGSGEGVFVHDHRFPEAPDGVVIRQVAAPATPAAAVPAADFRGYLEALIAQTSHINISGISVAGSVKGALRYPIEKLYTPLRSRAETVGLGGLRGDGLVGLPDLLPQHRRLLLEGQPGAGKTTFLRFVACMLARDSLGKAGPEGRTWRERYLGGAGEALTPVLVRISDLVPLLSEEMSPLRRDDRRRLLDFLAAQCHENEIAVGREGWRRLLEGGQGLLLLDGLDEVADEGLRGRIFEIFRDAVAHWQCPMVVTSRPIQTAELREMGFHVATVEPFGRVEIETFLDHWVSALYQADDAAALRGEGEQYREALLGALCDLPRVRRLASNPVMLTCLCVVHWNEGHLPEGRSRVYRAVVRWLIAARTKLRKEEGFTDRFAESALAQLALAMMMGKKGKRTTIDFDEAAVAVDAAVRRLFPALTSEDRRKEARRWLAFECLGSGIVEELPGRRLRFWHLTFQEFLAALQLAWRDDGEDRKKGWWPLVRQHLDAAQWRETIELFPGCLLGEGGEGRVDKLLERVLGLRGEDADLASEARVAGIVGRLLQTLVVEQYQPRPEVSRTYEQSLRRSLGIFSAEGAAEVPVEVRIAAAEALGRGGDPRLAPERNNFLPVTGLPGVRLGKYPVTVEEYQRFVESRGYEERKHWEGPGWEEREKEGWSAPKDWEAQLETPNRPVTGVSWFEASAYCRWLSEQRGEVVRLPTEAEWEKAATSEEGAYPWGEAEPNRERVNFGYNVGETTPVGIYPASDGPDGHCDLAGNVWEWCADEEQGHFSRKVARVVRGGGWFNPAIDLRTASRDGNPGHYQLDFIGFRVAAVPTQGVALG